MKKFLYILFALFLLQNVNANEFNAHDAEKDTVIIKFGNSSRIVIFVKDKEDLELLKQYDINGMLKDLTIAIDSSGNQTNIKIEDRSGERYLNDTVIVIKDVRVEVEEDNDYDYDSDLESDDDGSTSANIKIANVRITVDNLDDIDKIEEDFEDFENLEDFERREYYTKRPIGTKHSFNMDLGLNDYLENGKFPNSNDDYKVRPLWSFYVAFNSTWRTSISGPLFLEWGGGIDWYNFKLENDNIQIQQGDEMVEFIERPEKAIKSKLTASYANLKFIPMLDFSYGKKLVKEMGNRSVKITRYKKRGFRIGAGVYAGYRLTSYSKFVFSDEGSREKEHIRRSLYVNNWRYGVRVQMGFKGTDVFFQYDLNELFREGRGPELNPISFGFTL